MKNHANVFFICAFFCAVGALSAMDVEIPVRFSDDQIADWRVIEVLLADHGSLYAQARDSKGNTPLHRLCKTYFFGENYKKGFKDKVALLLNHRASLVVENDKGETPIHIAAGKGRNHFLESFLCLVSIADINKKNHKGLTALDKVILGNSSRMSENAMEHLVAHGATNLSPKSRAKLDIHRDACNGDFPSVKLSYLHNPGLLDSISMVCPSDYSSERSLTPLNAAAMGLSSVYDISRSMQETVAFLLGQRASTSIADSEGNIPLHHATRSSATRAHEVVKRLLRHTDFYVNTQNNAGETPLYGTIRPGDVHIKHATLLIEHNAQLDIQNNVDKTALYSAVEQDLTEMAALLLKHRASCLIPDSDGTLPIHRAADGLSKNSCVMVDLLIASNPGCVNVRDRHGDTPLHRAMFGSEYRYWGSRSQMERCETIACTLLLHDAQRDIVNNAGETPLDIARELNSGTMIILLTLDMDWYKKMRSHNAKLIEKIASLVKADNTKIDMGSAYQQLLDYGIFDNT
jgi:ankyrin repeat protein